MTTDHQKAAIVTGANTGLGFETSLGLAKAGYRVVLACRSADKAEDAMRRIKRKVKKADLDFIPLDLIDRESIRAFAAEAKSRYDDLDLLVNNAGVMGPPHTITQNNLELQFDANHVGHFYLTSLLIGMLDQDHETRIVNVSSLAGKREGTDIFFDNLNFEGNYEEGWDLMGLTGMVAYAQSKLANMLFNQELSRRLAAKGKQIKTVVVHPGMSNTDLSRNMPLKIRLFAPILVRFMNISTSAEGAQSSLYGALNPDIQSGDFIGPSGEEERTGPPGHSDLPPKAQDKALAKKLWTLTEKLLGEKFTV